MENSSCLWLKAGSLRGVRLLCGYCWIYLAGNGNVFDNVGRTVVEEFFNNELSFACFLWSNTSVWTTAAIFSRLKQIETTSSVSKTSCLVVSNTAGLDKGKLNNSYLKNVSPVALSLLSQSALKLLPWSSCCLFQSLPNKSDVVLFHICLNSYTCWFPKRSHKRHIYGSIDMLPILSVCVRGQTWLIWTILT